jgi:tRNA (mo5U34)-methyltransferase
MRESDRTPDTEPVPYLPGSREDLARVVRELGPWFHNLRLDGVETAPAHFLGDYPRAYFTYFSRAVPPDLTGWTVLDVGCNGGFYSFEMKRRGASRVLGIDTEPLYLRQARFAAAVMHMDVEFREASVYDVADLGSAFDLVLFMGVFYHLRHPLLALDMLRRFAVGRLMLFQSMVRGSRRAAMARPDYTFHDEEPFASAEFPRLHFVEQRYAGDDSNWWIPNQSCVEAMLRSAGFEIVDHPDGEVYLCRPAMQARLHDVPRVVVEGRGHA